MPYLPYTDLDSGTNQYPNDGGAGSLANRAASAVCAALNQLGEYTRAVTSYAGAPAAASNWLSGQGVFDRLCQPYPRTQPDPPFPAFPPFETNCATQGSITWRRAINWGQASQGWIDGNLIWNCSSGRGIPIAGPTWNPPPPGSGTGYYEYTFLRVSGTTETVRLNATARTDPASAVQILSVQASYCPSCNLPTPPPDTPRFPDRTTDVNPPTPPQITINIDFPRGWGLPPITFPVIFSPVIVSPGAVQVRPTLTLAPRVDLNPDFAFAPTFEFNLGGISIGGGGYPEPEQDVQDLTECVCPEIPPIPEVDYPRIQRIVEAVATTFRELPASPVDFESGPWVQGEFIDLDVPPAGRFVRFEFILDNYTGGETFGDGNVPNVIYPGWLTFGLDESSAKGSERLFLNYQSGFIPIPPWSRKCFIHSQSGAIARARIESVPPIGEVT